jgi:hypothetical protein
MEDGRPRPSAKIIPLPNIDNHRFRFYYYRCHDRPGANPESHVARRRRPNPPPNSASSQGARSLFHRQRCGPMCFGSRAAGSPFAADDLPSHVDSDKSGLGRGKEAGTMDVVPPQRDSPARICPQTARDSLADGIQWHPRPRGRPTRSKLLSWKRSLFRNATLIAILNERSALITTPLLRSTYRVG